MFTTSIHTPSGATDDLRHHLAPLELMRHTLMTRFERRHVLAPDSQFEFLPRRPAKPSSAP